MAAWCYTNCFHSPPYCPADRCSCVDAAPAPPAEECAAAGAWAGNAGIYFYSSLEYSDPVCRDDGVVQQQLQRGRPLLPGQHVQLQRRRRVSV